MAIQKCRFQALVRSTCMVTNASDPATVLPRTEWQAILIDAAVEVFSTTVGVAVTVPVESGLPSPSRMTGMVGIAGEIRAVFSLSSSAESGIKIASLMLGIAADDPGAEKAACDAVGEVCNIISGYFKARIGLGDKCSLSVPTIVKGKNYKIHSTTDCERFQFPLLFEEQTLWLSLDISK
ncbi:MAG TPA: chemotaxis protein CheX [Candidatus Sulfotelmatobacter sp.]